MRDQSVGTCCTLLLEAMLLAHAAAAVDGGEAAVNPTS